jgi:hypothetical protein
VCAEFAKVARQTGQNWQLTDVYKGFSLQVRSVDITGRGRGKAPPPRFGLLI